MPIIPLDEIITKEIFPGFQGKLVHSGRMTFAYWEIEPGNDLPEHSHEHEQVSHLLEGKFEFTIDGKKEIIEPGKVVIIPSNVKHSGRALTFCRVLDAFCPVREDYK